MQQENMLEHEIVTQVFELLQKAGFESVVPPFGNDGADDSQNLDATLIYLKTLNARFDKNDAIEQIRCLMSKYNIQLDQLIDKRGLI